VTTRPRVYNIHHRNAPSTAVYCGRGSPVGNPFRIGPDGTRDEVCDKFEAWAPTQPHVMAYIATLEGCDLLCFCVPARCHCNWVLRQANPKLFCN
jgi:hypothetical protein